MPVKPSDPSDDYTFWPHPHRDIRIYMRRTALDKLSTEALSAFSSAEPAEIGGILWGKTAADESLVISEVTLVRGSALLFNSTTLDHRNIDTALHRPAPEPTLSVLGYFRSQIHEEVCLTQRDYSLIEEYFSDPDSVVLVIRPQKTGMCMMEFLFWQNGRLQTNSSDLEVQFFASDDDIAYSPAPPYKAAGPRLDAGTPATPDSGREDAPIPGHLLQSDAQPHEKLPGDSKPKKPVARPAWLVPVIGASAVTLLCAIAAFLVSPVVRSQVQSFLASSPDTGIDLSVGRAKGGEISLNWNQYDPTILRAQGGTLNIIDGNRLSKLNLGYSELRSGRVTYSPHSRDVEFRLEVNSEGGKSITKTVHAFSPSLAASRGGERSARQISGPSSQVNRFRSGKSQPGGSAARDQGEILVEVPLDIDPAPEEPAPVALVVTTLAAPPVTRSAATDVYNPPFALEEMMPETTPVGQFEQVSVKVDIDPQGHVVAAFPLGEVVKEGSASSIAVSAAKRWIFHPAALNGKPVPSEYTIVFSFHPHTN